MSVLIKGMEMPSSCYKCHLRQRNGMDIVCPVAPERFSVADVNILEYRLDSCPLVPVAPHGDLIDQDEYRDEFMNGVYALCSDDSDNYRANAIIDLFDEAPTIIPASE